ncbi:hypothetical protein Dthio_PD1287 [Desulfonatronospira thiodismutans ASO3-1]|uniref:Uncharacterized protein n=1 Tax=Desulfonatronospira thiodismutans ASO3-1 TaxID=555779 RepID=D6STD2_9BACT|nr:hypothetical protein Dthio_PD1287 [Desulfonatronospira thiodismutans ASO3-1]RQD76501.1 MAG: hypothetical protein D5S03_06050 [Desulfonatronospira sp. MSAO_Bac3]
MRLQKVPVSPRPCAENEPLRKNIEIRKGVHTTTPGPSLAKEGSRCRVSVNIQRDAETGQ